MLIDMNGNQKKIPKKKKAQRLSQEQLLEAIKELMSANVDDYCFFYSRDGLDFKYSNCSERRIDVFVDNHQRDKIEDMIYNCLDAYFEEDNDEKESATELERINIQQDWIEEFIRKLISEKENNKIDEED